MKKMTVQRRENNRKSIEYPISKPMVSFIQCIWTNRNRAQPVVWFIDHSRWKKKKEEKIHFTLCYLFVSLLMGGFLFTFYFILVQLQHTRNSSIYPLHYWYRSYNHGTDCSSFCGLLSFFLYVSWTIFTEIFLSLWVINKILRASDATPETGQ